MRIEKESSFRTDLVPVRKIRISNRLAMRFFFKQIGGVKGSHIFEGLSKKTMKSMAYVLQKPEVKKT
jgi:hypothetical protein